MRTVPAIPTTQRAAWSYVSVTAYLALCFVSFPGDWLLILAAMYLFIGTRLALYHECTDDALKRKYAALGLGYFVFSVLSPLALPFSMLLPLDIQSSLFRYLLVPWSTGLLYLVPATLYLALLDRRAGALGQSQSPP